MTERFVACAFNAKAPKLLRPQQSHPSVGERVSWSRLAYGAALVERGTGASYMARSELAKLEIPYGLSLRYRRQFQKYASAVRLRCFETMQRVESDIGSKLLGTDIRE